MKTFNDYAAAFGPAYDKTPKAVFAALAYSLAMRLNEDKPEAALAECRKEWLTLHENGIVRQKPPRIGALNG